MLGQAVAICVEAVGVLHDELAAAQQAKARAHLVAILPLDVVEALGQLLVGAQLAAHQAGDELLGGGRQGKAVLVAVLQAHQLGAVDVPAAAFVPELGRLDDAHAHLLAANGVHFLAQNILDFVQNPETQR